VCARVSVRGYVCVFVNVFETIFFNVTVDFGIHVDSRLGGLLPYI